MINLESFFNKSYVFTHNEEWVLPSEAYTAPPWTIDSLQHMKAKLNSIKGQLNKYPLEKWSEHTKSTDPSGYIIPTIAAKHRIELLTQAWCKFYECLNAFSIIPKIAIKKQAMHSLHLCEAPGGFVSALNYFLFKNYRKMKWKWNAVTLNPYYEATVSDAIFDVRLIRHTSDNWDFGTDETGDLKQYHNHQYLVDKYLDVTLITADGSIDCMNDPGEQEHNVHHLHYCEIMTSLKILRNNGSFVLKLFTMFEHGTICLMYLLNCVFKRVTVFKPCASKSGNSEVYVIALQYKGAAVLEQLWDTLLTSYKMNTTNAMFEKNSIHANFLNQLDQCAQYFMEWQSNRINHNIELFEFADSTAYEEVMAVKEEIANLYTTRCTIVNLPNKRRLLKKYKLCHLTEWDFKVIHMSSTLDDDDFLKIRIGRAIELVLCSNFGTVSAHKNNSASIINAIADYLPANYVEISDESFKGDIPQYILQRKLFYLIIESIDSCCDIVIHSIPLLTRLLVGIIYILSLGFESVIAYKQGALVFRGFHKFKCYIVKRHFEMISNAYSNLKSEDFIVDLLEVLPLEILQNNDFYEVICTYNTGMCL